MSINTNAHPGDRHREARLLALFDELHQRPDHERVIDLKSRIIAELEPVFRDEVLPRLRAQVGGQATNPKADRSLRYTELVNSFFERVLQRTDDPIWRARTLRDLYTWASRCMVNLYRDHYRRTRGRTRTNAEGEQVFHPAAVVSIGDEALHELAQAKAAQIQSDLHLDWPTVLETIDAWEDAEDEQLRQYAQVIRYRYMDELSTSNIARLMIGPEPTDAQKRKNWKNRIYKLQKDAVAALRRKLYP